MEKIKNVNKHLIKTLIKTLMTKTHNYSNQEKNSRVKSLSQCPWQRLTVIDLCQRISYSCHVKSE